MNSCRLAVDHCIYRYEDAFGRVMLLLHYVDDIVAATTDRSLREIFFDHIRKKWAMTAEWQMNMFLGIAYTWDREKGSCKASAAAYMERVARRFGLENTRTYATPMEAGFEISESDFVEEPTAEMGHAVIALFATVDESFAMCKMTRRSHFMYTTFLNNGLVSWKSKLQSIVTLSSESDYVALYDLTCEMR